MPKALERKLSLLVVDEALPMSIDKRQHPRVPIELDVTYRLKEGIESHIVASSINLSVGGIFIRTDLLPPLNSLLVLSIGSSHLDTPLSLEGKVVWLKEATSNSPFSGVGISFQNIDRGTAEKIESLITEKIQEIP